MNKDHVSAVDTFRSSGIVWRTSTVSGANGDCVEVACLSPSVLVRDSKNRQGPLLVFGTPQWQALTRAVRTDTLSR